MKGKIKYTVFGYYADNDQRAGFEVTATSPDEAEDKAAKRGALCGGDFRTCAVLKGKHRACESREYIMDIMEPKP